MSIRIICFFTVIAACVSAQQIPNRRALEEFPRSYVSLLEGSPFKTAQSRSHNAARNIDADRMLYNFRENYGLSTLGARPLWSWEAPECKLRGHLAGHYLTALALGYAATGDEDLKNKAQYMIEELKKCQDAAEGNGFKEGFLSAYPEKQFIDLENGAGYGTGEDDVWAPWYTQHKIIAGMLDSYEELGDTTALYIAKKMGDWAYNRLSEVAPSTLKSMWSRHIAGEYGGMNEELAELYRITEDEKYLTCAKYFDAESFGYFAENRDVVRNKHANQLIPRLTGALRIYNATGEESYYSASSNFWDIVVDHYTFIMGGMGIEEYFRGPDQHAEFIQEDRTAENCASYNMAKLSKYLYLHNPKSKYMDYWERVNLNHILSHANVSLGPDEASPYSCYMTDVMCGADKNHEYIGLYNGTCCDGTGIEGHLKYGEIIYASSGDTLYINQFIASQLNWKEKDMSVRMESRYPASDSVRITVEGTGEMPFKIRIPGWVRRNVEVKVNNEVKQVDTEPGSFIVINRDWSGSDVIELVIPQTLRCEKTQDDSSIGGVLYGNQVLVGLSSYGEFSELNCSTFEKKESGIDFLTEDFTFTPFYNIGTSNYTTYWYLTNIPDTWGDTLINETGIEGETAMNASYHNKAFRIRANRNGVSIINRDGWEKNPLIEIQVYDIRGGLITERIAEASGTGNTVSVKFADGIGAGYRIFRITAGSETYIIDKVILSY